jgi:tetratricopeptide (TPR) repeat protein
MRHVASAWVVGLLVSCGGATRLEPGVPVERTPALRPVRLRLPRGPVELSVAPSDAHSQAFLVVGDTKTRLVDRPDFSPHRLAFEDGSAVEVELSWLADTMTPVSTVRLEATTTAPGSAAPAFDRAFVSALARTSPPTAEGLSTSATELLSLAEATTADVSRASVAWLTAATFLARTGDPKARTAFEKALASPLPFTQAAAHLGLAHLDQQIDARLDAQRHLEAAAALAKDNPRLRGWVAWAEGEAMAERSEYSRVLAHLRPHLHVATTSGDDALAAMLHAATGWAWKEQGDRAQKVAAFEAQAVHARRTGDGHFIGIALHNLGNIHSDEGEWAKALPFFEQAVAQFRIVGDLRGLAFSLDASGEMESTLEQPIAIEHHREAYELRKRLGHVRGEGQTLVSLGSALTRLHRPEEAFEPLRGAVEVFHRIGDTQWEAYAWFRMARASLEAKQFADATAHARQSLAIAESVRERIASDDRRASYTGTGINTFDVWIAAAMAQAQATGERRWFGEALEAFERSRARSLLEVVLRIDADRPAEGGYRSQDDALRARIRALEFDLRSERAKPSSEALEGLEATMRDALAEYETLVTSMQRADSRAAQLASVPLATLDEVERLAGPDTLVVEYAFGRKSSWALVMGGGAPPSAHRLPDPSLVRSLAQSLVEDLSARNKDVADESAAQRAQRIAAADAKAEATRVKLREAVVPFGDRLAGKKRLAVVADDSLQLVPWAAVVSEVALVQVPSVSVVLAQRRRNNAKGPATNTLTVVSDPVFGEDDPRLPPSDAGVPEVRGGTTWRRLPYSASEGEALAKLVPSTQRRVLTGYDASRENVLSGGLSGARMVHFATHGVLDLTTPEKSGLVLARRTPDGKSLEGFLSLADVYALRLSADLVTLSACETALGSAQRGEGLIGLARGFLHAGARSVVASLWKVNDKATALLMEAFYEGLLVKRLPAAVALVNAQRTVAAMERYRSPYFWAGFVLVGDPRG